eukprot:700706-Prymnesium_polylepis.1
MSKPPIGTWKYWRHACRFSKLEHGGSAECSTVASSSVRGSRVAVIDLAVSGSHATCGAASTGGSRAAALPGAACGKRAAPVLSHADVQCRQRLEGTERRCMVVAKGSGDARDLRVGHLVDAGAVVGHRAPAVRVADDDRPGIERVSRQRAVQDEHIEERPLERRVHERLRVDTDYRIVQHLLVLAGRREAQLQLIPGPAERVNRLDDSHAARQHSRLAEDGWRGEREHIRQ